MVGIGCITVSNLFVKLLYLEESHISLFQFLSLRSIIQLLITVALIGTTLKQKVWDTIPRDQYLNVTIRSVFGVLGVLFVMNAI